MNYKIYQVYFDEETKKHINTEFIGFDNSKDPLVQYREYSIFQRCQNLAKQNNLTHWGYFSWKWQQKLTNISAQNVLDWIDEHPGYDVYTFNPYPKLPVGSFNVWEQALPSHDEIIEIIEYLFPIIGLDKDWIYQPMHPDIMFFAHYCTASVQFWNDFLQLSQRYYNAVPNFPSHIAKIHNKATTPGNPNLWYFPFIHERLLSTFLAINKEKYKVIAYHPNKDELGALWDIMYFQKTMFMKYGNVNFLKEWFANRRKIDWWTDKAEGWGSYIKSDLIESYNKKAKKIYQQ